VNDDHRHEVASDSDLLARLEANIGIGFLPRTVNAPPSLARMAVKDLELAIELATEAGADAFVGWQASRCVARWESSAKVDKGLRRWDAVARSAARQSRRPYIPSINGVVSTAELVHRVRDGGAAALVLHESAIAKLTELPMAQADSLLLIIGPEGGIADDEIATLSDAGATAVRLGPTVLRTSTAAAVALGALGALTSRWS